MALLEGTTFHTSRKTFITHLIRDSGGDISVAQQLAGHSTPAVTAAYYVGRDVEHQASRVSALRLVSLPAVEHAASTRPSLSSRSTHTATREVAMNPQRYDSELPRRKPSAFIFL